MKKIILILTFFLSFNTFSQTDLSKVKVTYGAENETLPSIGDTIREYYPNSKTLQNLKFRDSKKFIIIEFDENGKKTKSTTFPLDNLKYKTLTKFHENGNVILIASYSNGIVTGKFEKFYDNGKPMEIGTYDRMKRIGVWEYYNENGVLVKTEHN